MTDLLVSGPAPVRPRCGARPAAGSVGARGRPGAGQAIRMMRHPVLLLGLAWYVVLVGLGELPAHAVRPSTRPSRGRSPSWWAARLLRRQPGRQRRPPVRRRRVDAQPADARLHRTGALLLACLAPAAFAAVLDLGGRCSPIRSDGGLDMHVLLAAPRQRAGDRARAAPCSESRSPGCCPGPGCRWSWSSGWCRSTSGSPRRTRTSASTSTSPVWTDAGHDMIPAMVPGDPSWHLVYLRGPDRAGRLRRAAAGRPALVAAVHRWGGAGRAGAGLRDASSSHEDPPAAVSWRRPCCARCGGSRRWPLPGSPPSCSRRPARPPRPLGAGDPRPARRGPAAGRRPGLRARRPLPQDRAVGAVTGLVARGRAAVRGAGPGRWLVWVAALGWVSTGPVTCRCWASRWRRPPWPRSGSRWPPALVRWRDLLDPGAAGRPGRCWCPG